MQCLAKVFIALHFIHILCCSLMLLHITFFYINLYTRYTIMKKQKTDLSKERPAELIYWTVLRQIWGRLQKILLY